MLVAEHLMPQEELKEVVISQHLQQVCAFARLFIDLQHYFQITNCYGVGLTSISSKIG